MQNNSIRALGGLENTAVPESTKTSDLEQQLFLFKLHARVLHCLLTLRSATMLTMIDCQGREKKKEELPHQP